MINRQNIRHAALLKPQLIKNRQQCKYQFETGSHAYAKTDGGFEQCVECGRIKTGEAKERQSWDNTQPRP